MDKWPKTLLLVCNTFKKGVQDNKRYYYGEDVTITNNTIEGVQDYKNNIALSLICSYNLLYRKDSNRMATQEQYQSLCARCIFRYIRLEHSVTILSGFVLFISCSLCSRIADTALIKLN